MVAVEADAEAFANIAAEPAHARHRKVTVHDDASAAAALQLALRGADLLIHAVAPRFVLDRLYDDLRHVGAVSVRTAAAGLGAAAALDEEARAILELIAQGMTVPEAAAALHLSLRTANRRLAAARKALGVTTTIEAIAMLSARE